MRPRRVILSMRPDSIRESRLFDLNPPLHVCCVMASALPAMALPLPIRFLSALYFL
jgi:hypothetical protein